MLAFTTSEVNFYRNLFPIHLLDAYWCCRLSRIWLSSLRINESLSTSTHKDVDCGTAADGCASKAVFLGRIQRTKSFLHFPSTLLSLFSPILFQLGY